MSNPAGKVVGPKGPIRRSGPGRAANAASLRGEKRPPPPSPASAAPAAKKPRAPWFPKVGDEVRAVWSGDFYRSSILRIIAVHEKYVVAYVASPTNIAAGIDPVTATVAWKDIQRSFNLVARPEFATDDEKMAFQTSKEVITPSMKVLAKRDAEHGGDGSWLPAVVDEDGMNDDGTFDVEFCTDRRIARRLNRMQLEPMFTDSPLKRDAEGYSVWPTAASAETGAERTTQPAEDDEEEPFDELPQPMSHKFNTQGNKGYSRRHNGMKADGTPAFNTILKWQNIALMDQTTKIPGDRASKSTDMAQYERMSGTLDTGDVPEDVLAEWTGKDGSSMSILTKDIRTVWWQCKTNVGIWLMFEGEGNDMQHIFCLPHEAKRVALNMACVMSQKVIDNGWETTDDEGEE